jgi:hypothetical protein
MGMMGPGSRGSPAATSVGDVISHLTNGPSLAPSATGLMSAPVGELAGQSVRGALAQNAFRLYGCCGWIAL